MCVHTVALAFLHFGWHVRDLVHSYFPFDGSGDALKARIKR